MSLDLTYAEARDRMLKSRPKPKLSTIWLALVLALLIAAAFGVILPDPIRGYGPTP